jgi:hypothetical protein
MSVLRVKNVVPVYVPKGTTHMCQPLDVGINGPLKCHMRALWDDWMSDDAKTTFTPGGNRRRPSYQQMCDMVSSALNKIEPDTIRAAFRTCGIAPNGKPVPITALNQQLQKVMSAMPDEEYDTMNEQLNLEDYELIQHELY